MRLLVWCLGFLPLVDEAGGGAIVVKRFWRALVLAPTTPRFVASLEAVHVASAVAVRACFVGSSRLLLLVGLTIPFIQSAIADLS